MRKRLIPLVFCVFLLPFSVWGQTVGLSLENQQVYLLGDTVQMRITVRNESPSPFRFRLADDRALNLDVRVRTFDGEPVEQTMVAAMPAARNTAILYRDIVLDPGESFFFTESLNRYAAISEAGTYVVEAHFVPELRAGDASPMLASNTLQVTIRPSGSPRNRVEAAIADETREVMRQQDLNPDEVVRFTLEGLAEGRAEQFLLYLDLAQLYQGEERQRRLYERSTEAQRQELLAEFRTQLSPTREPEDGIARIPSEWRIERTTYTPQQGEVTVFMTFGIGRFVEERRYIYFLERQNDIWTIVDYQVAILN